MKVLILPGFSVGNREWIETLTPILSKKFTVLGVEWNHWANGSDSLDMTAELAKIKDKMGDEEVSIVAKSVGTHVVTHLLKSHAHQIKRIILSGIPLSGLRKDGVMGDYHILGTYPTEQITIYQNEHDPWGSYAEIKAFIGNINPAIEVISKPRGDHSYPYAEDYLALL